MKYGILGKERSLRMKKNIKLIGLDLDGTVFDDDKKISYRTMNAIKKAIEKGIIVVPATGRPIIGVPNEILTLEGIEYALTANGAAIYKLHPKRCIFHDCLEEHMCADIITMLNKYDVMADAFIDGMGYVEKAKQDKNMDYSMPEVIRKYILATRKAVPNLVEFIINHSRPVEKLTVNFKTREDGSLSWKEEIQKELEQFSQLTVVSGISTNLEITKDTATKGNGLLELGKQLGIDKEQIMACGDSGNDKEMLEKVGFGVAMENASEDVKLVADYITKSNQEDGVAFAIEQFVL